MRELIVRDDRELRRLNRAIAMFGARPDSERLRIHHLRSALVATRNEIELPRRRRVAHSGKRA